LSKPTNTALVKGLGPGAGGAKVSPLPGLTSSKFQALGSSRTELLLQVDLKSWEDIMR